MHRALPWSALMLVAVLTLHRDLVPIPQQLQPGSHAKANNPGLVWILEATKAFRAGTQQPCPEPRLPVQAYLQSDLRLHFTINLFERPLPTLHNVLHRLGSARYITINMKTVTMAHHRLTPRQPY